jgi:hypothetical protein
MNGAPKSRQNSALVKNTRHSHCEMPRSRLVVIWSFGVILLTGKKMFPGKSVEHALHKFLAA